MTKKPPNESAGNILLTNIKVNKSSLDFLSPDNQYSIMALKPTCKYFHLRYCFPVSFVRPFPFSTIHNIPTNDPIPSPILRCKLFIFYKTFLVCFSSSLYIRIQKAKYILRNMQVGVSCGCPTFHCKSGQLQIRCLVVKHIYARGLTCLATFRSFINIVAINYEVLEEHNMVLVMCTISVAENIFSYLYKFLLYG